MSNNEELKKDISKSVTTDVIREMDFLFQAKERQEEEHFRKLDTLIRQQSGEPQSRRPANDPLGQIQKICSITADPDEVHFQNGCTAASMPV